MMGVSSNGNVSGNGGGGGGGAGGCCDMSLKCWCRWKLRLNNHYLLSPTFVFLFAAFVLLGSIASLYAWLVFTPYARTGANVSLGCQEDNEGSWSIGIYYGDSPFSLKPIEEKNVWVDEGAAWPVANPVLTCASASSIGFPSNFVANPFLYIQGDEFYMFYETKNSVTKQGDIGVAKSVDNGATWKPLGIALAEDWHLSFPFVFDYDGQIYMMPESSQKGKLRVYRAIDFPLQWKLEKVIIEKPIINAVIVKHSLKYWLFGSDYSTGMLEIWCSDSPLGPWKPHKKNPIHNARNAGRPFVYNGHLYRIGQGNTYGKRIHTFKIKVLTEDEYKEVEVPLKFKEANKGRNSWNGIRTHHIDVQQLSSGKWVGVMDGDRVPSGDSVHRFAVGCASILAAFSLVLLLGFLLGVVKCTVPPNLLPKRRSNVLASKTRRFMGRLNRVLKPKSRIQMLVLVLVFGSGLALMCNGVSYLYGGNGAVEPYDVNGQFSQFTLVTMTYEARLWNLKMYIKHYSRCPSVRDIVVIWNKGTAPDPTQFDSPVPIWVRVEESNSLNNRFKPDPLIETRAVLELDDDIMMTCRDIERGFRVWRAHPERIVGFYPRLVDGSPVRYLPEKHAREKNGYNMILTGAAFLDSQVAFERYWSDEAKRGRGLVDKLFNCEDVLMNYLYANATSFDTVEYVRPMWAIDTSKFSGAAISKDTNSHYRIRTKCLSKFSELYGSLANRKSFFNSRGDGWDV